MTYLSIFKNLPTTREEQIAFIRETVNFETYLFFKEKIIESYKELVSIDENTPPWVAADRTFRACPTRQELAKRLFSKIDQHAALLGGINMLEKPSILNTHILALDFFSKPEERLYGDLCLVAESIIEIYEPYAKMFNETLQQ